MSEIEYVVSKLIEMLADDPKLQKFSKENTNKSVLMRIVFPKRNEKGKILHKKGEIVPEKTEQYAFLAVDNQVICNTDIYQNFTVTITLTDSVFWDILSGVYTVDQAYFRSYFEFDGAGWVMDAVVLRDIFSRMTNIVTIGKQLIKGKVH